MPGRVFKCRSVPRSAHRARVVTLADAILLEGLTNMAPYFVCKTRGFSSVKSMSSRCEAYFFPWLGYP